MYGAIVSISLIAIFPLISFSHDLEKTRKMHYGTFYRVIPDSAKEWNWNEITLVPGEKCVIKSVKSDCEYDFGLAAWEQVGDTLVFKNYESWTVHHCTIGNLGNLVRPEAKYLLRSHERNSFEILPLSEDRSKKPKWSKLQRKPIPR